MKTISRNSAITIALFLFLCVVQPASAFYSPSVQRWVNRDPIGEKGFNRTSRSVSTDPEHLFSIGMGDRIAMPILLRELTLIRKHYNPYAHADLVESDKESVNFYLFNHNNAVDQIDSLGLIAFTVTHPCLNPLCKYCPFCSITVDKPNRFPRRPILLAVCLNTALKDMNLACGVCNYAGYEAGCVSATRCFQFLW